MIKNKLEIINNISVIAEYNPKDIDIYISEKLKDGKKKKSKKRTKKL
jgi:hypothetical protein